MNAIQAIPRGWRAGCIAALCVAWGSARAGVVPPLYVGNNIPVLDQNGVPLEGTIDSDPAERARVEVRQTATGAIFAPSTNGAAHPANPLLTPDSVGGIGLNAGSPGLFAMVFPQRPATGTRIFGRVFNAPTAEAATFYADSEIRIVPATGSSVVLTFGPAQPLDSGDSDGDGLINSWEEALGIADVATADYDGDGIGDYNEWLMGTDPADAASGLAIRSIVRVPGAAAAGTGTGEEAMRVGFLTQPGRKYQLEEVQPLDGEQVVTPIGGVVVAGDEQYEMDLLAPVAADAWRNFYRIRWVP